MMTMGAAAFGAFVSFPIATAGGVGLGLVYQIVLAQTNNAGTAELAAFGVILLAVLIRGKAIGRAFAIEGAAVPERPSLRIPETVRNSPFLTKRDEVADRRFAAGCRRVPPSPLFQEQPVLCSCSS